MSSPRPHHLRRRFAPVLALGAALLAAGCTPPAPAPATPTPATPGGAAATGASRADDALQRAAVTGVVRGLFDAMRAGDSAKVRASFHPRAFLGTALVRNGQPALVIDSLETFVRAVGTPHAEVWDERLANLRVELDGPLAAVWTDYTFYVGTKLSHCGVDAFHLARTADGWRIISLTDTRRREACPELPAGS